jgi:hypothetical protein
LFISPAVGCMHPTNLRILVRVSGA